MEIPLGGRMTLGKKNKTQSTDGLKPFLGDKKMNASLRVLELEQGNGISSVKMIASKILHD